MLEARVRGAGIDEEGETELADVAESLKGRRVDQLEGERVETDVVPEWVADDFHGHVAYHSSGRVGLPDRTAPPETTPLPRS